MTNNIANEITISDAFDTVTEIVKHDIEGLLDGDTEQDRLENHVLLESASGVGKSYILKNNLHDNVVDFLNEKESGKKNKFTKCVGGYSTDPYEVGCFELNLADLDISDTKLPYLDMRGDRKVLDWAISTHLPQAQDCWNILLMDELGQASLSIQKQMMQFTGAKTLNGYTLPPKTIIVGATNRSTDNAGVKNILSTLRNRFISILSVRADSEAWLTWGRNNGVDPLVLAFVKFAPQNIHTFEKGKKDEQFCSPRALTKLSRLVKMDLPDHLKIPAYCGCVGTGVGNEFYSFENLISEAPSVDSILKNPKKAKVVKRQNVLYALCSALIRRTVEDNKHFKAVIDYLERVDNSEYAIFTIKTITDDVPPLKESRLFADFIMKNKDFYLTEEKI